MKTRLQCLQEAFLTATDYPEGIAPSGLLLMVPHVMRQLFTDPPAFWTAAEIGSYLGISPMMAEHLFFPGAQIGIKQLSEDTTAKKLAAHVKAFNEKKLEEEAAAADAAAAAGTESATVSGT